MWLSNIDIVYVPTGMKSLSILEKMHPNDTNVSAVDIIDKCENRADNLHSMCLADFSSSCLSKKADDLQIEREIKSYTFPVSNIDDVKLNAIIIV